MKLSQLEEQLEIHFNDPQLLKQAFTHSSYVNEHRDKDYKDNERLEFLGDAVLELGVSQHLYLNHTDISEGQMTKLRAGLVREASLVDFAYHLNFDQYILLGKGEEKTGGRTRPSVLADVFESFLGALYLDQGFDTVLSFLETHIYPMLTTGAFSHAMDYKSELQELVQTYDHLKTKYEIVDVIGPSHDREFVVQVKVNDKVYQKAVGRTIKEAEQRAAKHVLDNFSEQ